MAAGLLTDEEVFGGGKKKALLSDEDVFGKPERSFTESVGRQVGLTARAGASGVASLANMFADPLVRGANSMLGTNLPVPSEALQRTLTRAGLPEPESATERVSQDVAGGMAGAGGMTKIADIGAKASSEVGSRVAKMLADRQGLQIAAGGSGPGAAAVARENDVGPGGQLAAGVAGAIAPYAGVQGGAAAVRGAFRGGEQGRQRVAENIKTFADAGTTPSVGQATESPLWRAYESGVSKSPGGYGRMQTFAEGQADDVGKTVEGFAKDLSAKSGAAPAGRTIKAGAAKFVDDFKTGAEKLYDVLDQHIPKQARVDVSETRAALEALNADIPGAPALSQWFKSSKIQGIEAALRKDAGTAGTLHGQPAYVQQAMEQVPGAAQTTLLNAMNDGALPYEAIKKLRTLVGQELANPSLVSDVPRSKWQALYTALSKDLEHTAAQAGPDAQRAFSRANAYYRAGIKRIDDVLQPVLAKGDPEDIFQAAVSGTRDGATTISGVMRSLPAESRDVVTATVIKRMGQATPGVQNDAGDLFSLTTFLTNWNRVSPDAKMMLFNANPGLRKNLDQIAKVSNNAREGSRVYANPSGTQPALSAQATGAGALVALATGNPGAAAAIGGAVLGANISARLLTNPEFVKWLAATTRMSSGAIPAQLRSLGQIGQSMDPQTKADLDAYVSQLVATE